MLTFCFPNMSETGALLVPTPDDGNTDMWSIYACRLCLSSNSQWSRTECIIFSFSKTEPTSIFLQLTLYCINLYFIAMVHHQYNYKTPSTTITLFLLQIEVPRDKTTLSLNSQCLPCLGGNLILNNTTDT